MAPDIAQEFKVVQFIQPFRVVDHHRPIGCIIIIKVCGKHLFDACDVLINHIRRQQGAFIGAKGWIAHLGRATAHQRDRTTARFLQPTQHHDLDQAAHMQRTGRCIKSDIGRHAPFTQRFVQSIVISAVRNKAAF